MDLKEYIASGILEAVLLGCASPQEVQEVACLRKIYPELDLEFNQMQRALENFALAQSVEPPEGLLQQIKKNVRNLNESSGKEHIEERVKPRKVITPAYSMRRLVVAASMLGFLILGVGIARTVHVNRELRKQVSIVNTDREQLQSELSKSNQLMERQQRNLEVAANPAYQRVNLSAVEQKAPSAQVTVFWNASNKEVYLNLVDLPEPPVGKGYQLWAIGEQGPQSAGMLDYKSGPAVLQRMEDIESAAAFAITLENETGVEQPTLEEMFVIGKVAT